MGSLMTPVTSELARLLSSALGKKPEELDGMDGEEDGRIYVGSIDTFKDRIAHLRSNFASCEFVYVIDNGDGKLDKGDLFLDGDGFYQEEVEKSGFLGIGSHKYLDWAFRFAKLFEEHSFRDPSEDGETSPVFPSREKPLIDAVESLKGLPFNQMNVALEKICSDK